MEIFYELMMKNGFCFLVGTNHEGICEFSINGYEFAIYTLVDGEGEVIDFSFSAITVQGPDTYSTECRVREEFSVLSVRKIDERFKKRWKALDRKPEESVNASLLGRRGPKSVGKNTEFCAYRGSVKTPNGWISA